MELYTVDVSYVRKLYLTDNKVQFDITNENKEENRRYIGVVFEFGSIKYFAPHTHNCSNWNRFKKSEFSIDGDVQPGHTHNRLGKLLFLNMIPVPEKHITLLDIESLPGREKRKHRNMAKVIKNRKTDIIDVATRIYKDFNNDTLTLNEKSRCLNFNELENIFSKE